MGFKGLIGTLPIGIQGFNGSRNPSKLGPGHLGFAEGVDIDGGVLLKEGGAEKLNTVALGAPSRIMSGINWSPVSGAMHDVIFLSDGTMRRDVGLGTFPTTLASGLNVPTLFPPYFMVAGGEAVGSTRKLFMFSESNQVRVVSGTGATATAITTPPADWSSSFPIFGVQHVNRVWGGGNASDPHRIYYSTTTDHQNYTGAGSGQLSIYPGEGDQLVGGISFRGLLILFKYPRGIYVVDTRDADVANWRVDRLNNAVGACSPWCIVQISNDVVVLDPFGQYYLMSTINDFSDVSTTDIGRANDIGPFMRANVNLTAMRKAMGGWYSAKGKAWFMVPLSGSVENNLRMVLDFNDPQIGSRYYLSRRDVGCSLWLRPDAQGILRPTLGDNVGFIRLMDQEERNKDGLAYQMFFETSENDFSFLNPELGPKTKNGAYLEITSDLVRNSIFTVTPSWDGVLGQPMNFALGSAAAALGAFILDVDVLSAAGIVTASQKLNGQGRRLKLSIENIELDDEARISEVHVGFTVADERLKTG